jgi:hypothetical protein
MNDENGWGKVTLAMLGAAGSAATSKWSAGIALLCGVASLIAAVLAMRASIRSTAVSNQKLADMQVERIINQLALCRRCQEGVEPEFCPIEEAVRPKHCPKRKALKT